MGKRDHGKYSFETSNEDKVLFPKPGYTKGDLIDYYEQVAEHMLPHVKDRPVTMQRFPDGIDEDGFFQKSMPDYFPDWIDSIEMEKEGGKNTHVVINKAATLGYIANQAAIDLHVGLSRADKLKTPDLMVFDLDPADEDFEIVRKAGCWLREVLTALELPCYVKSTGSRGVHVTVPLQGAQDFDEIRDFARDVADYLAREHPEELTTEQRKNKREGRLFIDVLRNAYGQTAVAPYSVRSRETAPVAVPLEWEELKEKDLGPQHFDIHATLKRIEQIDDPWKDMYRHARSLTKARKKLKDITGESGQHS